MKRTIEASLLSMAACAALYTGFSRGVDVAPPAIASAPTADTRVAPVAVAVNAPVSGLPDLDHTRVDYWVTRFTTDMRRSFSIFLERKDAYEPMIAAALDARDMPQELIYLAMIESGFNPAAKSPAKAVGLWQFIAPTAQRYGLKVAGRVDERKDPEKSTDAALQYLGDLYDRFGSWYLAAAAYNTGEGRVSRLMKQITGAEKGEESDYYAIWHRLPAETRDYVPKMVAAMRIAKEPAKYGFEGDQS